MTPTLTPPTAPGMHRAIRHPAPSDRSRALTAAARARLEPLCVGWPYEQFAALVSDVVRFRERWDAWGSTP